MIESTIINYLQVKTGIPASAEVPAGIKKYIVVEKTGGSEEDNLITSMVAVQTCAETLAEAMKLAYLCRDYMKAIAELDEISEATINSGPYNYTDTSTKTYRYQTVYDLVHY